MSVMAGRFGYASPAENWRTIFFFSRRLSRSLIDYTARARRQCTAGLGKKRDCNSGWVDPSNDLAVRGSQQPSLPVRSRRQFLLGMISKKTSLYMAVFCMQI